MAETLLRTKLNIPLLRPNVVPRPNLIKRLNQGIQHGHKLTLVSAPAGFGKTSLVSEWVRDCDRSGAWLSLDKNDNDLTRFLIYLIAAFKRIDNDFSFDLQVLLSESQSPQFEILLTKLINEIEAMRRSSLLVLDDYHLIDSKLKTITQPLIEPLSDREFDVLRLMAAGYKYKEIAESLFISINTVRYHNRNIFSKLNVNSRFQAIERAREMHLL